MAESKRLEFSRAGDVATLGLVGNAPIVSRSGDNITISLPIHQGVSTSEQAAKDALSLFNCLWDNSHYNIETVKE